MTVTVPRVPRSFVSAQKYFLSIGTVTFFSTFPFSSDVMESITSPSPLIISIFTPYIGCDLESMTVKETLAVTVSLALMLFKEVP